MKYRFGMILFLVLAVFVISANAQEEETTAATMTVKISTPTVQCDMCKERIEKNLKEVDGIKSVNVDYEEKFTEVEYDPEELDLEDIRDEISDIGYQADDVKANKRAYKKLHNCCKLPEDRR